MTIVETTRTNREIRAANVNAGLGPFCPAWCDTHADHARGETIHARFIEEIRVDTVTWLSLEIAVVQHEYAPGQYSPPEIYIGIEFEHGHRVARLTVEAAELLSRVADGVKMHGAWRSFASLLKGLADIRVPLHLNTEDLRWAERLPIALRHAVHAVTGYMRTPCPTWCVDSHLHHMDTCHCADGFAVELSRYLSWDQGNPVASRLLLDLRQDYNDRAPIVVLVSHDDAAGEEMTLDEAEQLGHRLLEIVASGRESSRAANDTAGALSQS